MHVRSWIFAFTIDSAILIRFQAVLDSSLVQDRTCIQIRLCSQSSQCRSFLNAMQEGTWEQTGIAGLQDAQLTAQTIKVTKDGRKCIVTAIAIGQRLPSEKLEDTAMHWGCSGSEGKKWQPPPHGWHTIPPVSRPAGGLPH